VLLFTTDPCRTIQGSDAQGLRSTGTQGATAIRLSGSVASQARAARLGAATAVAPSSEPTGPAYPLAPLRTPPLAPTAPTAPTSGSASNTSACGTGSGSSSGNELAILATAPEASLAQALALISARAADRTSERTYDPGSRPG
jgi:hypothetical protein